MKFTARNLMIFCVFALISFASQAGEVRDYPLSKIAPHTYVIHGPLGFPSVENQGFMNNPGFVITKSSVVIIDPGATLQVGRMLLKQIKTVTKLPVSHVFNTHVHGDHWLGNQAIREAYPKAKLLGHPAMIQKIKEGEGKVWVSLMNDLTKGYSNGTRSVPPEVPALDHTDVKIGGMTFRIHAPEKAHSHTDIMIEAVEESVVFTGDNVLNQTIARMVDGTFKGSIAACDRIAAVKAKHYVPGHGPTGDVSVVTQYRQYLSTVFNDVKQQYDEGKADFEMKARIVAKLKPYLAWDRFDVELGKHISLAVLEIEATM